MRRATRPTSSPGPSPPGSVPSWPRSWPGFDEVIATRLEVGSDGRLTGRLDGPNVRAEQKAIRLAEALASDQVEIWAYGDSIGDREMLAMADHPVWAGRRLRRLA
jgi:phosphatidylglycerophosphatase C